MKKWFSLPKEDQSDLIRVTAARMKMDGGIIEKDLWLLAVLDTIFNSEIPGNRDPEPDRTDSIRK
jgi:hypothetical protein